MRKTKKHPVQVTLVYPDGRRFEARIKLSEAYTILAALEADKERTQK